MSYQPRSSFKLPPDPETTKIWRYMSVLKFLRMLDTNALHFTVLARLEDPWEGVLPEQNRLRWARGVVHSYERLRETTAVNCWHIAPYESAALWKIYCPAGEGVVVQSTPLKLIASLGTLTDFAEGSEVHLGMVRYDVDFDTGMIPPDPVRGIPDAYSPLLYKRNFYEFEHELRAVLVPGGHLGAAFYQRAVDGWDVPVDLET